MTSSKHVRAKSVRWVKLMLSSLAAAFLLLGSPAVAHKDHDKKKAEAAQVISAAATPGVVQAGAGPSPMRAAMSHDAMGGMDMASDRAATSFPQRLIQWIGRLHPFLVHFPIAFFPAALFTALVGRRRPAFSAPVQFLVVAGGVLAPFAAAAGWIAGTTADPEPILVYHRWVGIAVAIGGVGLAIWAWRRPWEDRGAGMILALSVMTLAIAVQGFLGAALTHGLEHLMF